MNTRRNFLKNVVASSIILIGLPGFIMSEHIDIKVTGLQVHTIKVNHRGSWVFIGLETNKGITSLGEAS